LVTKITPVLSSLMSGSHIYLRCGGTRRAGWRARQVEWRIVCEAVENVAVAVAERRRDAGGRIRG
jgi:hypothetical protein